MTAQYPTDPIRNRQSSWRKWENRVLGQVYTGFDFIGNIDAFFGCFLILGSHWMLFIIMIITLN